MLHYAIILLSLAACHETHDKRITLPKDAPPPIAHFYHRLALSLKLPPNTQLIFDAYRIDRQRPMDSISQQYHTFERSVLHQTVKCCIDTQCSTRLFSLKETTLKDKTYILTQQDEHMLKKLSPQIQQWVQQQCPSEASPQPHAPMP